MSRTFHQKIGVSFEELLVLYKGLEVARDKLLDPNAPMLVQPKALVKHTFEY